MIDTFLGDAPAEDWRTYSPVLRAKSSEWKSLELLSPGVRRRIAPILEFIPDWNTPGANTSGRKRRAPQNPAEYVAKVLESTAKATPDGTRSFVYFGLVGPLAQWNGVDLWAEYAARVPGSDRVIPLAHLAAFTSPSSLVTAARSRGEIGLRLRAEEIGPQLASRVSNALQVVGLGPAAAHLVIDLKDAPAARSHAQMRAALGNTDGFVSIAVLAGVFPADLTQYQPGVATEPRAEWTTWWHEHVNTPFGERMLGFGDYTTQCAHYRVAPEVAPSVSLRYTTDDAVLVFRGRQSNGAAGLGYDQMHGHCRLLVRRADYDGAAFSSGDQQIYCWTDPTNGPGNATQWRTASVVHHITHVVAQLHDPVGSSASGREWARQQPPAACA